ncbi:MAG: hypothetical protein GF329_07080 [Candidatus Lokiarchaeota archaeon]|nr:hypothetical protein [Candidatus Lokiarchaeota archaeon]
MFSGRHRSNLQCVQVIERQIKISNIADRFTEFKSLLFNELEMREFLFDDEIKNTWYFTKEKMYKVKLKYNIEDNDVWIIPKVGYNPKPVLLLILMSFAIIPIHYLTYFLLAFFTGSLGGYSGIYDLIWGIFPWTFFIILPLTIAMQLFMNYLPGYPKHPQVRYSIQKSVYYVEEVLKNEIKIGKSPGICPSCNRKIDPKWKVCAFCGYRIKEE